MELLNRYNAKQYICLRNSSLACLPRRVPSRSPSCVSLDSEPALSLVSEAPGLQFVRGQDVKISSNFVSRLTLFVDILKDQWNIPMVCCCSGLKKGLIGVGGVGRGCVSGLISITHGFNVVKEDFTKINTLPTKSP